MLNVLLWPFDCAGLMRLGVLEAHLAGSIRSTVCFCDVTTPLLKL